MASTVSPLIGDPPVLWFREPMSSLYRHLEAMGILMAEARQKGRSEEVQFYGHVFLDIAMVIVSRNLGIEASEDHKNDHI